MFQIIMPESQPSMTVSPPAIVSPAGPAPAGSGSVPAEPDLSGFQKSLSVEPVLAEHGFGIAHAPDRLAKGTMQMVDALRNTLPQGWQVYAKPGVSLKLPIIIWGSETKTPWTQTLRKELQDAGLHGALWWNQKILTVWAPSAPHLPVQNQPLRPDLQGYQSVGISSASAMSPAAIKSADISRPLQSATPIFTLNKGDLILTDLQKWAAQSDWNVVWQVSEDWEVPNTTTFAGDFQQAVTKVVEALAANGANIHAVFHTANNTVVISGAGGGE